MTHFFVLEEATQNPAKLWDLPDQRSKCPGEALSYGVLTLQNRFTICCPLNAALLFGVNPDSLVPQNTSLLSRPWELVSRGRFGKLAHGCFPFSWADRNCHTEGGAEYFSSKAGLPELLVCCSKKAHLGINNDQAAFSKDSLWKYPNKQLHCFEIFCIHQRGQESTNQVRENRTRGRGGYSVALEQSQGEDGQ